MMRYFRPTYWRVRRQARQRLGPIDGARFTRLYFAHEKTLRALGEIGNRGQG